MSQGGFTKTALTLITTKGDLLTHSTVDTRLPVGADGTYLKADSSEPTGLRWAAGGGGGGNTLSAPNGGSGGGGSGAPSPANGNGSAGTTNTGGGGGGAANETFTGGAGGSGIVLIRYKYQ